MTATDQLSGKVVALCVCGGIAAYKVVELARELTQAGADVKVVMTPSATEFVGPITFSTLTGNPVRTELFEERSPSAIPHTDLGRTADIVVVAPATAKTIAKFAQGISDDLVGALLISAKGPIVMAPAMHTEMWENGATVENIRTLKARGVRIVGPDSGPLAGPDVGPGRLVEVTEILQAVREELSRKSDLVGRKILITAGGTREPIDAVRFIGNRSSGKMAYALAYEAVRRGAEVTLVTAPSHLTPPSRANTIQIETAEQMHEAVSAAAGDADVLVLAAAVADWRPKAPVAQKLKKSEGPPEIVLEPTADIAAELGRSKKKGQLLVGFAAETDDVVANGRQKLSEKGLDMIVSNQVGTTDSGFETDTNRAWLISSDGTEKDLGLLSKNEMARKILDAIAAIKPG